MQALLVFALGFAPGLVWLWFFRRRDGFRPLPRRILALTFFLGILSTFPAALISFVLLDASSLDPEAVELTSVAAVMLLIVGPVEETCKFLAVRVYAARSSWLEEPSDALIVAAAASLGFASLENVLYIFELGPAVMIGRAPLSTVGHVIFASFWAEALGRKLQAGSAGALWLPLGLLAAAVAHGLFNVAVTVAPLIGLLFVVVGLWWLLRRFGWARRASPFRYRRNVPQTACLHCGGRISVRGRFCRHCGATATFTYAELWCSHCGLRLLAQAVYCPGCGDRLEID